MNDRFEAAMIPHGSLGVESCTLPWRHGDLVFFLVVDLFENFLANSLSTPVRTRIGSAYMSASESDAVSL